MNLIEIKDQNLMTFQGEGEVGMARMLEGEPVEKAILRPKEIEGKVLRIDQASGLCASSVLALLRPYSDLVDNEKTGIVCCTRYGNYQVIKDYVQRVNKNRNAPSLYAAAGYNICAGISAIASGIKGPSIVNGGVTASIADTLLLAKNYLHRKEVDSMVVVLVDVAEDGSSGVAISFLLSKSTEINSNIPKESCDISGNTVRFIREKHPFALDAFELWQNASFRSEYKEQQNVLDFPGAEISKELLVKYGGYVCVAN